MSILIERIVVNKDITVCIYDDYTEVSINYIKGTFFKEEKTSIVQYWYRDYDRVFTHYNYRYPNSLHSLYFRKDNGQIPNWEAISLSKTDENMLILQDIEKRIETALNTYKERGIRVYNSSNNNSNTDTLFCRYCGKKIEADSTFCKYCGKEQ